MLLLLIASFNKLVSRISLTRPSFDAAPRQCTVAPYSAYIFKALGVTSAQGLCGMHPGVFSILLLDRAIEPCF